MISTWSFSDINRINQFHFSKGPPSLSFILRSESGVFVKVTGIYVWNFTVKSQHAVSLYSTIHEKHFQHLYISVQILQLRQTYSCMHHRWIACSNMVWDFITVFVQYKNWFLKPLVASTYAQARYNQYYHKSDNLYTLSPWKIQYVSISIHHLLKCPWA